MVTAPGPADGFPPWRVRRFITRRRTERQRYDIVQSIRTLTLLRAATSGQKDGRSVSLSHSRRNGGMAAKNIRMAAAHTGNRRAVQFRISVWKTAIPGLHSARRFYRQGFLAAAGVSGSATNATVQRATSSAAASDGGTRHYRRSRLRRIFSHHLGFSARMPAARHRVDHARAARRTALSAIAWASAAFARFVSIFIFGGSSTRSGWRCTSCRTSTLILPTTSKTTW